MDMASQTYTKNLAKLVADGKVTEAQLDAWSCPSSKPNTSLASSIIPMPTSPKSTPLSTALKAWLSNARSQPLHGPAEERQPHPAARKIHQRRSRSSARWPTPPRDIEGGWTVEGLFGGAGKSHPVTVLAGIKEQARPRRADQLRLRSRTVTRLSPACSTDRRQQDCFRRPRPQKPPTGSPRPKPPQPMPTSSSPSWAKSPA